MQENSREDYRTRFAKNNGKQTKTKQKHHTSLYRFLAVVVLFSVLMFAFKHRVTVFGINEARLEQMMSDESHWNMLIKETDTYYQKAVALLRDIHE